MPHQSRRNFLRTASIGTAAVGVATVLPFGSSSADAATSAPTYDGAFAVWVADAKNGDVAFLVGEREVTRRDPALARRLATIAVQPKAT
jgi:hypothetical protein